MALTVGSLFAGIGGFDLGFERAGFEIRWQVEIDPFCRAVLAKHWPAVRRYADVRDVAGWGTQQSGCRSLSAKYCLEPVDVVCGGFPCQPHSLAGRRAGAQDDRDLWPEFARLIRELQPRWVVAENVPGLLSSDAGRFFGTVLGDLAACGYDAEWDCLPASAFGAPHRRDRVWLIAYPNPSGSRMESQRISAEGWTSLADADRLCATAAMGDTDKPRIQGRSEFVNGATVDAGSLGWGRIFTGILSSRGWLPEPDVGRVAHGIPARVDRLRGLGNSIVPQIAEWIGRRIREADR